ncbi:MAG TPA: DUF456 domain-containing protein [Dehalococcoidia bacterium]|jgi:uncharacterized protein YqgC (DUF456 family)|nr:DUF456 domain-containing protein [Dehalococcoidia bacterium]
METVAVTILCSILMVIGLLGVVLPILPGIPLSWLGFFIYALGTGFERISIVTVVIFTILTVLTLILDFAAPMLGAKKYQASKLGIFGAFLGFTIGIFVIGFWGIILGPFIGALLGELIAGRKPKQAIRSALGAFLGFIASTLFKIIVILTMAGFFIASLF